MDRNQDVSLRDSKMSINVFLKEFIKRAVETQVGHASNIPKQIMIKPQIVIKPKRIKIKSKIPVIVTEKPKPRKNLLQNVSISELMQNPVVISLECKGPNIPLIMKTRAGPSEINKVLSLEEINEIIQRFSEESHIPITEVFRAIVNNMMITASLSNPETPQFIITKLSGK